MTTQTIDLLVHSPDETISEDSQHTTQKSPAGANGKAPLPQQNQPKHVSAKTGAAYWGPGEMMTFELSRWRGGRCCIGGPPAF